MQYQQPTLQIKSASKDTYYVTARESKRTRTVWKVRLGVYSPLAQSVERLFYMQDVVGSNPTGTTIIAVLAQLGERFLDVEEVTGSIPVDCTNENMRLSRRLAAFSKKAVAIKKTSAQQIGGIVAEPL